MPLSAGLAFLENSAVIGRKKQNRFPALAVLDSGWEQPGILRRPPNAIPSGVEEGEVRCPSEHRSALPCD